MRSKWRAVLFSALVALSLGFAVYLYEFPRVDTSSFDSSSAPLTIGVYVTDPNMRPSIQFEVFHDPSNHVRATLFIREFAKGTILLTSTMQDTGQHPRFRERALDADSEHRVWVDEIEAHPTGGPDNDPRGFAEADFLLPADSFPEVKDGASVEARLPAIGPYETGVQYAAPFVHAGDGIHAGPKALVPNTVLVANDPSTYRVPSGAHIYTLYWEPKQIATSEALLGVGELIASDQVQVNVPSTGTPRGSDFLWTGSFGLSPALKATDSRVLETRSRNDLLLGIALATAAAASVALIQEGPDRLPWPLRRSAVSKRDAATDEPADSAGDLGNNTANCHQEEARRAERKRLRAFRPQRKGHSALNRPRRKAMTAPRAPRGTDSRNLL